MRRRYRRPVRPRTARTVGSWRPEWPPCPHGYLDCKRCDDELKALERQEVPPPSTPKRPYLAVQGL